MSRQHVRHRCRSCQAEFPGWYGQCPRCQAWNSLEEISTAPTPARRARIGAAAPIPLSQVPLEDGGEIRVSTRTGELDRVLGGGLVSGSLVLIGGDPGVGKSTLLLTAAAGLASRGLPVLYVSGEESARQVRLRADRMGVNQDTLFMLAETDLGAIRAAVESLAPRFLILDSVQVLRSPEVESVPGSVPQVRAVAEAALQMAKGRDMATILVGHVTKEGTLAGPRMLEHLVDTVVYFECDLRSPLRILRAVKNRFGATGELGLFEMAERGLVEVPDASARLLSERPAGAPGTTVAAAMEGNRPILAEIQALVGRQGTPTPARVTLGLDRARLNMLLAVLEKAGVPFWDRDVYASATGGIRLMEPAVDLAMVAALLSSREGRPLPGDVAWLGEVGLAGEVRGASFHPLRFKEALRHGFSQVVAPRSAVEDAPPALEVVGVRTVGDVIDHLARR